LHLAPSALVGRRPVTVYWKTHLQNGATGREILMVLVPCQASKRVLAEGIVDELQACTAHES